jgi:hypothetical protein
MPSPPHHCDLHLSNLSLKIQGWSGRGGLARRRRWPRLRERVVDLVQPSSRQWRGEGIDVEGSVFRPPGGDGLRVQVDGDLARLARPPASSSRRCTTARAGARRQQAVLHALLRRCRRSSARSPRGSRVVERPDRMLARGAAAEVGARPPGCAPRANAGWLSTKSRALHRIQPHVVEKEVAEVVVARLLQVARGHDLVGVDVGARQRHGQASSRMKASMLLFASPASRRRTSVSRPVTAAAAAIAGLIRCVRDPGPCRPTKLRLEVEAQRWPGTPPGRRWCPGTSSSRPRATAGPPR